MLALTKNFIELLKQDIIFELIIDINAITCDKITLYSAENI